MQADLARRVTRRATTRYETAITLQNWFRTEFEYSLDSPAGHGEFHDVSSMLDFIERLADATGLPVGIKSAVGELEFVAKELGCTLGQGFLFSQPIRADEIEARLKDAAYLRG